jgi:thioredoxin 1
MSITIEMIAAPGCKKCTSKQDALRARAASIVGENNLIWREVNVIEELDYAVSLGVLSLPALAIDGSLAFPALPSTRQLEAFLLNQCKC